MQIRNEWRIAIPLLFVLACSSSDGTNDLAGADLTGADLTGADLTGVDLAGTDGGGMQVITLDAGPDQTIKLPNATATFSVISNDRSGSPVTYLWTLQSGGAAMLSGQSTAMLSVNGVVAGTYVFRVTATDGNGASAYDEVSLDVVAAGTTYYFSSSGGDDTRSSIQAQDPTTPWKSGAKLNTLFATLMPGDAVFFKRGDTFTDPITVGGSGTAAKPIWIGAYGTGDKPVLSGLQTVSGWTSLGGSVWQSNAAVSTLATLNLVLVNGVITPMGRYPNTGYRTIASHVASTSITDSTLGATPVWTGGQLVIRQNRWTLSRNPITSHATTTINYTTTYTADPIDGFGYFIQNHPLTLDTEGEWYYDAASTKKLSVYAAAMPTNVQVATVDTLMTLTNRSYVTIDSLSFTGANGSAFLARNGGNLIVQNCDFKLLGGVALDVQSNSFTVQMSTVDNAIGSAMVGNGTGGVLRYNTFTHIGLIPGAPDSGSYSGVTWRGAQAVITNNTIDHVGYDGIFFNTANGCLVDRNVVQHHCSTVDDGGGIYTGKPPAGAATTKITNNVVMNGVGASAGTNSTSPNTQGIYIDDDTTAVEVANNTSASNPDKGYMVHNSHEINIHDNTGYDNNRQIGFQQDNNGMDHIANIMLNDNTFVSKQATQWALFFSSAIAGIVTGFGTADNNIYARPIDDTKSIDVEEIDTSMSMHLLLAGWQMLTGQDAHSKASPATITSVDSLRFEYNTTTIEKTVALDATYVDMKGASHTGSITLPPFGSAVLIKQ